MKKSFKIEVSSELEPEIAKKLRRILKPVTDVWNPGKCELCGAETTWTINKHPVCPLCHVKYGFFKEAAIPGPCEICGCQGEWYTGKDDEHDLCFRHRDAWFDWTKTAAFPDRNSSSKEEWLQGWDAIFARFVEEMKERLA